MFCDPKKMQDLRRTFVIASAAKQSRKGAPEKLDCHASYGGSQ
jgi:hypothetical protein